MAKFEKASPAAVNFGSKDVTKIISNEYYVQKLLDVEVALATAEAELNLIPADAAVEIKNKAKVEFMDDEEYARQFEKTGHVLVALLNTFKKVSNYGGEYIHWGATTCDITDTALMLQISESHNVILEKTKKLYELTKAKATEYRDLVMMGRTNDQQALPITLGFKIATWADELGRDIERLEQARSRMFVGEFYGAVGTLASLGEIGLEVQKKMFASLGVRTPQIAWFASRDRFLEYTCLMGMLCATLGRIANEIYNEQRHELGELSEKYKAGSIGSSTMPHKRNPFAAMRVVGNARVARTIVAEAFEGSETGAERDARVLGIENDYLGRISCCADGSLDDAIHIVEKLDVNEKMIKRNLHLLQGLVLCEAFMMELGKHVGRMEAHEIVHEKAMVALDKDIPLKQLLMEDERVTKVMDEAEIDALLDPEKYIGLSQYFVDNVTK